MATAEVIRNFRQLKVWQLGMELTEAVYRLTSGFPQHEIYALTNQLRRAAVSIPSNMAEGNSRDSTKEYLYHVSIAAGSLAELETQIELAHRLDYSTSAETKRVASQIENLRKMICGLQRSLRAKT